MKSLRKRGFLFGNKKNLISSPQSSHFIMTKSKKMKEEIREVPDDIIQVGFFNHL